MKDIKSVIIGFLLATCMFLLMGFTDVKYPQNKELGRYQAFGTEKNKFMIDTMTGQSWINVGNGFNNRSWREHTAPYDFVKIEGEKGHINPYEVDGIDWDNWKDDE